MFFIAFTAFLLECILGTFGFFIPLCGWTVFYFGLVFSWRECVWSGVLLGIVSDIVLMRGELYSPFILLVFALCGIIWKVRYTPSFFSAAAGAFLANLLGVSCYSLFLLAGGGGTDGGDIFAVWVFEIFLGTLLIPPLLWFFDEVFGRLNNYPRYFESARLSWRTPAAK